MSKKAVRLKNDNYLDSTSIVHKKKKLSTILDEVEIVETIENENGTAIKYANGRMVCTKTVEWRGVITNTWGSLFVSPLISLGDYAAPFIAKPIISANTCNTNNSCWVDALNNVSNTSLGVTYLIRGALAAVENTYRIDVTAIGRWK